MRFIFLIFVLIFSCSTKKDVLLIQDAVISNEYKSEFKDIKIKSDDILRIKVSTKSPELSSLFSFNDNSMNSNNLQSFQVNGYIVNSDGFIKIPLLNPIYVKDLTLTQASNLIEKLLSEQEDLTNPTVDIKIVNAYFTVLGEVSKPGRYNFIGNDMDLLQALGMAGDLTINGERDDIKIIRKDNDVYSVKNIDITSSLLFSSDNIQIFPGDIIIVNPNEARVKNAGIIGNSGNLLSVLSFILSSLILLTNQ